MTKRASSAAPLPLLLAALAAAPASALPVEFSSVPVEVVRTDLCPRIAQVADNPIQFAVSIEHLTAPDRSGVWAVEGKESVWRYRVQVPGALSLSFHAREFRLPSGVALLAYAGGKAYSHTLSEAPFGELWSRVARGDALALEARMAAEQVRDFRLDIDALQAGYRRPGEAGAAAHPCFTEAKSAQATSKSHSCETINFKCVETARNRNSGRAVIGLLIDNVSMCTATLLNNTRGDRKPYVLSAEHCRIHPGAETGVRAYWNQTTPCGQPLETAMWPEEPSVVGGIHRASMLRSGTATGIAGDAWLIELLSPPPPEAYAWWAGIDASDAPFGPGGYGIHHADTLDQQFVEFEAPTKKDGTDGWRTWSFSPSQVRRGRLWHGASGSPLYDPADRVVGVVSGGDACQYGAGYTRLGAFWDGDGTPGSAAKVWLDPGNTGRKVIDGDGTPAPDDAGSFSYGGSGGGGAMGFGLLLALLLPRAGRRASLLALVVILAACDLGPAEDQSLVKSLTIIGTDGHPGTDDRPAEVGSIENQGRFTMEYDVSPRPGGAVSVSVGPQLIFFTCCNAGPCGNVRGDCLFDAGNGLTCNWPGFPTQTFRYPLSATGDPGWRPHETRIEMRNCTDSCNNSGFGSGACGTLRARVVFR